VSGNASTVMNPLLNLGAGGGGLQRSDLVLRQLLDDMAAGQYAPGQKLPVEELADTYGVSITPVRDALMQLEGHGVVEKRPYQGYYVRSFTQKEIQDLYEVRMALEVLAVSLACRRRTPAHIEQLRSLHEQGAKALANNDLVEYRLTNNGFHATLMAASGNELLQRKMSRIAVQLHLMISQTVKVPGRPDRASGEHLQIINHLEKRDEKAAEELMRRHIFAALEDLEPGQPV